jgi:hypothetical protein
MIPIMPADKIPMTQMLLRRGALPVCILVLFLLSDPVFCPGGDLYKWVDEEGVVHMTDTPSQIPAKYRDQVDRRTLSSLKPEYPKNSFEWSGTEAKRFEIPYKAFEGSSRRIIIPVTFNDSVTARMLLDTGSPGLMISPRLASRLGLIDERDGNLQVMAGGVGGSVSAMLAIVDRIKVGDTQTEFLPATITRFPSDEFEGLVGMDFMANYRIGIDTENSVLIFEEIPPQPDRPGGHDAAWWRSNFSNFAKLRDTWSSYLDKMESEDLPSSEREKQIRTAKRQHEAAVELCRKLERYASDNAVPLQWRH